MPPSAPPRDDQLVSNSVEAQWLVNTKKQFSNFRSIAFQNPPVSPTLCLNRMDPKGIWTITHGINSELDSILHDIYVAYGPINLHLRGRDSEDKYYIKCSESRDIRHYAQAVICVLPADKAKSRTAANAPSPVSDGKVQQDQEIWEDIVVEEDDDWVKV